MNHSILFQWVVPPTFCLQTQSCPWLRPWLPPPLRGFNPHLCPDHSHVCVPLSRTSLSSSRLEYLSPLHLRGKQAPVMEPLPQPAPKPRPLATSRVPASSPVPPQVLHSFSHAHTGPRHHGLCLSPGPQLPGWLPASLFAHCRLFQPSSGDELFKK